MPLLNFTPIRHPNHFLGRQRCCYVVCSVHVCNKEVHLCAMLSHLRHVLYTTTQLSLFACRTHTHTHIHTHRYTQIHTECVCLAQFHYVLRSECDADTSLISHTQSLRRGTTLEKLYKSLTWTSTTGKQ